MAEDPRAAVLKGWLDGRTWASLPGIIEDIDAADPLRRAPDPFTWLAQCVTCGQVHEKHPAESRGVRGFQPLAWTWADPDDGHTYRPRYMTRDRADGLRDEYEANCAR